MSLYGINAYMSNSYYSNYSNNNNYNKNTNNSSGNTNLLELMKKVDMVRSQSFKKDFLEGKNPLSDTEKVGSLENEKNLATSASELSKSAAELSTASMDYFYDKDKVTDGVKSFVESYNKTVDALQKSDSVTALEKGISMTNSAKAYAGSLSRVGIKLDSKNKLTVDEETLQKNVGGQLKSLFGGYFSFANKTADKANDISRAANIKAEITYNSGGNLDYFTRMAFNNMFSEKI